MCVHDARAEKWWMARRWRGWRQRGRVGDTRVETAESGAVRAGRGARAASHGGGKVVGEEQQPGGERERERAERELTPLPRHQIASFSPLSPSLAGKRQRGGAPSSSPAAAAPLPSGGGRKRVEGGRWGGREFIIGGVRMQGGGPRARRGEEREESGGPGGKKRGDRKKKKREREATKRFVTPRIPPYTRATESYARIPKEDSPPPFPAYFPFFPFTFFQCPLSRACSFSLVKSLSGRYHSRGESVA